MRVSLVVQRPWEQGTAAILEMDLDTSKVAITCPETVAFQRTSAAVTRWIKETDAGRLAWEESSEDFNIGDLDGYMGEPKLQRFLQEEGVRYLGSSRVVLAKRWEYDSLLVDEDTLYDREEEDDSKLFL